jgi:hypothetical protein
MNDAERRSTLVLKSEGPTELQPGPIRDQPQGAPRRLRTQNKAQTGGLRCRLKFFRSSGPKTNPLTVIPSNEGSGSCLNFPVLKDLWQDPLH